MAKEKARSASTRESMTQWYRKATGHRAQATGRRRVTKLEEAGVFFLALRLAYGGTGAARERRGEAH
jgi:hypothetical protein